MFLAIRCSVFNWKCTWKCTCCDCINLNSSDPDTMESRALTPRSILLLPDNFGFLCGDIWRVARTWQHHLPHGCMSCTKFPHWCTQWRSNSWSCFCMTWHATVEYCWVHGWNPAVSQAPSVLLSAVDSPTWGTWAHSSHVLIESTGVLTSL
jgi:hypothetical protein